MKKYEILIGIDLCRNDVGGFLRYYLLSVITISRITFVTNARCSSNECARECERIENANPFLPKPRALHLYRRDCRTLLSAIFHIDRFDKPYEYILFYRVVCIQWLSS